MIMGNQAIALGALQAGVNLVSGYPGTPSSEIIEYIAKYKDECGTYVEWSVNEKAAVEVAAGASYAGARVLVTMKQVGLNVASDPVMCLSYVGVKGGMVIVSADDPGPISSQTEQDTRHFAHFSKLPVFDPSTPLEAYQMIQDAFEYSEKFNTPVLVRPTTRVNHAYESMSIPPLPKARTHDEFSKDTMRWVIFPKTSFMNHKRIFERNEHILPDLFSSYKFNKIEGKENENGIITEGISYQYVKEALVSLAKENPENESIQNAYILKIATPYPFPEKLAKVFLQNTKNILAIEELDPVLEREIIYLCGKEKLARNIFGKLDEKVSEAGENSVESVKKVLCSFYGIEYKEKNILPPPQLPIRPPVLCAGCPHRGSFYAVKQATKGKKTVFCGDIGCYTLGNAKPLDMCDTCLCMGADVTMAQGFYHTEKDRLCFSFIGDSTFFASGITGVVNAVYNKAHITLCVLDNSTTAMTGHQPHPGTGVTMMGDITEKISIPKILEAIGVNPVLTVNPFDLDESKDAVKKASETPGVSAIIFKSPCIAIASKLGFKNNGPLEVNKTKCIGCKKCITELGCPALNFNSEEKKVSIESATCTGCTLCQKVCPVNAISKTN